jgi:hypothetical protein
VRSDDGDWSLYAPDKTDEQIADEEATPLISGHAEWMEEHEVWDRPHSGDYAVANIKTAFSLDDLLIDLRGFEEAYGADDLENALKANGIDMFKLPSFGGDRPSKTANVWSWDERSAPTKSWQQAGRDELMNCESARNTAQGSALVGMARDLSQADRNTVRTGIGAELRTLHSDLLRKEIPDRMAELIKQLDQPMEASPRGHNADDP